MARAGAYNECARMDWVRAGTYRRMLEKTWRERAFTDEGSKRRVASELHKRTASKTQGASGRFLI